MYIETIYKIHCEGTKNGKECGKHYYINNGDCQDLTMADVTLVQCPYCKTTVSLLDDIEEEMLDIEWDESPTIGEKKLS